MEDLKKKKIGIIMPISDIDDCSSEHWLEVKKILFLSCKNVKNYDVEVNMVCDSEDNDVIQKRIIQNIYSNDLVICDVSCKNANVMFELGLRLAFDKPTIIIKDDKTEYSFDTNVIEHLIYRRDLRYFDIEEFKLKLTDKIVSMFKSIEQGTYITFLKSFGTFTVMTLNEESVGPERLLLEKIEDLKYTLNKNTITLTKLTNERNNRVHFINKDIELSDDLRLENEVKIHLSRYLKIEKLSSVKKINLIDFEKYIMSESRTLRYIDKHRLFNIVNKVIIERDLLESETKILESKKS